MAELDMLNRDPNNLNDHVKVSHTSHGVNCRRKGRGVDSRLIFFLTICIVSLLFSSFLFLSFFTTERTRFDPGPTEPIVSYCLLVSQEKTMLDVHAALRSDEDEKHFEPVYF